MNESMKTALQSAHQLAGYRVTSLHGDDRRMIALRERELRVAEARVLEATIDGLVRSSLISPLAEVEWRIRAAEHALGSTQPELRALLAPETALAAFCAQDPSDATDHSPRAARRPRAGRAAARPTRGR